eukprot:3201142-Rhodomonas_salina.2
MGYAATSHHCSCRASRHSAVAGTPRRCPVLAYGVPGIDLRDFYAMPGIDVQGPGFSFKALIAGRRQG